MLWQDRFSEISIPGLTKEEDHDMNFRNIAPLALIASALTLSGCGKNPEEVALRQVEARLAAAEQTVANQAATSKQLAEANKRLTADLADREMQIKTLTSQLADTKKQLVKTQVARNHLVDQVKGAQQVAGTAVDRAHAKGVEAGFGKPSQKKKS